ncbi:MAG: HEAT repeat domain-containing protein, partial [Elainellaceae cyanobacterium]
MKFFPLKNVLITLGKRFSVAGKVPIIALGTIVVILLTSWLSAIPSPAISVYPPIVNNGAYPPFNRTCTLLEIDQFVVEFLEDMNTPNESEDDEYNNEGIPGLITCGEEAVPALVELLETEDEEILRSASLALQAIGSEAAEATPALIKLLE